MEPQPQPEVKSTYDKDYYNRNKAKVLAASLKWRLANQDYHRNRYLEKKPEISAMAKIYHQRRKAKMIKVKCEICNRELYPNSLDRHNTSKIHAKNVALQEQEQ